MAIDKKQIVFIESYSTVMIYKIAKLLRERGYETVLIKLLGSENNKELHNESFDKIIHLELDFFKINIKNSGYILKSILKKSSKILRSFYEISKLKPYIIIARATPSWPCAIARILTKKAGFVYFPYDIRTEVYRTVEKAKELGGLPLFEIKAERFCFEHSDGIIHKGDPKELEYLNGRMLGDNIKFPKYILNFYPYSLKNSMIPINKNKLSLKDGEIHTVFVGSIGSSGPDSASPIFDNIEFLVKAAIHVHTYLFPNNTSKEKVREFFSKDSDFTTKYKWLLHSKYFHYHDPIEPNKLSKEISKYDFGLWPAPTKREETIEPKMAMGNKFANFIEAGIPFLAADSLDFINRLGEKYGISLSYNVEDIGCRKNIKKILIRKKKTMEKNIIKAREDFLMENHMDELEQFMTRVVKSKLKVKK